MRTALPQNYMNKRPTLLEDFSNIATWTVPTNCTIAEDTANVYTGTKSVRFTTTSATAANGTMDKDVNVKFNDRRIYVKFYCETDPLSTVSQIFFYFGSAAWTKYFYCSFVSSKLRQGWNYLTIVPDMCTYVGGETWDSTFIKIRMAIQPPSGKTAVIIYDGIYHDGTGLPKIVLTFDDAWKTVYDNAFQYMNNRGIRGTMYTIPNYLRDTGTPSSNNLYMSTTEVKAMHDAGWCIANHTINHAFYTTENYTIADYKDKVKRCADWLNARGYRGAYHIAYPRGEYDASVIQAMKEVGMKTGRSVHFSQQHTYVIDDLFQLNIRSMSSDIDLPTARGYIDSAIQSGTTCILMFHQIPVDDTLNNGGDSQPSLAFSQSKFQSLMDYIAERKADVVTIDEWYDGLTNPRRKV